MVAVIEGKEEAYQARFIEFRVHRSDGDPGLIATLKLPAAPAQDGFLRASQTALLGEHTIGMAQA